MATDGQHAGTEAETSPDRGRTLRISGVDVHRVNLPLETAYLHAPGEYHGATKVILEVRTEDGAVGLGELPTVELGEFVERELAPSLIGANALDREDCFRRSVPELKTLRNTHDLGLARAFGGVELALWDLQGKAFGVPLHTLLGGAARTEILFSEYFAFRLPSEGVAGESTPLEVARYCARMREQHGSTIFEGKVGNGDHRRELEMVREIRAAVGDDAVIRLDANQGWSLATARRMLRALEPYDIANIEDPVADFRDMAKLREHSIIPFSTHLPDLRLAVELGVPDTFVLNVTGLGGITETIKFINACETFGVGFWFYSGDSGVATAAYLQLSAALPYVSAPHQSLLRWYVNDVIAGGPFQARDNVIEVPDGPGLGVELDRDAVDHARALYERDGVIRQLGFAGDPYFPRVPRE